MVPRTPIAVKPPSPAGHLFASPAWSPGIRSRAAFLHHAPPAVLIPNEPESERPGPEDSQPRLPAEYPRPGNPQAAGQRRKPNTALSPIGATYAAQPSISAATSA